MLEENRQGHQRRGKAEHTSLLTGLLYDAAGERYVPSHTNRSGRRYRYYELRPPGESGGRQRAERLPAGQIESVVRQSIEDLLASPARLKDALRVELSAEQLQHVIDRAQVLRGGLAKSNDRDWRDAIVRILQKIVIHASRFSLHISPSALMRWLFNDELGASGLAYPETWKLDVPCKLTRRGEQLRIVIEAQNANPKPDALLIKLLQRAFVQHAAHRSRLRYRQLIARFPSRLLSRTKRIRDSFPTYSR